jgi:tetratricopeptide (TPR) repeat protein
VHTAHFEEALAMLGKALVVQPDAQQALLFQAHVLAELNRSEEALSIARRLQARGSDVSRDELVYVFARAGAPAEARAILQRPGGSFRDVWSALGCLQLGMKEEAYRHLEDDGITATTIETMHFQQGFDLLRSEPRFQRLLQSLGLVEANARAQRWRAANPAPTASR